MFCNFPLSLLDKRPPFLVVYGSLSWVLEGNRLYYILTNDQSQCSHLSKTCFFLSVYEQYNQKALLQPIYSLRPMISATFSRNAAHPGLQRIKMPVSITLPLEAAQAMCTLFITKSISRPNSNSDGQGIKGKRVFREVHPVCTKNMNAYFIPVAYTVILLGKPGKPYKNTRNGKWQVERK